VMDFACQEGSRAAQRPESPDRQVNRENKPQAACLYIGLIDIHVVPAEGRKPLVHMYKYYSLLRRRRQKALKLRILFVRAALFLFLDGLYHVWHIEACQKRDSVLCL
jgi:hypothetical protein